MPYRQEWQTRNRFRFAAHKCKVVRFTASRNNAQSPRDRYLPRPNGKGGMTRPLAQPIGLKVEEAMTSAEIDVEMVCPLKTQSFPPGTHEYDPKKHCLIEGVSKYMITREEAWAKFSEYRNAQGPHDEVYTDGSKINKKVGAAAVINRHFHNVKHWATKTPVSASAGW